MSEENEPLLEYGPPRKNSVSSVVLAVNEQELTGPATVDLSYAEFYSVVGSLFLSTFLSSLDTTIVTTLLGEIASDLNAVSQMSWIGTAYLFSCAAFQPLFGKLSDIFGRKNLLLTCCLFFGSGCLISARRSFAMVVLGRFITGIGGGGLATLGTITMSDIVPLRKRGMYQGMTNIFYGIGSASGGVIGGLIADHLGWKFIFYGQVPFACVIGFLFFLNLPSSSASEFRLNIKRVDFLGSVCLIIALQSLMMAAAFGGQKFSYASFPFTGLCCLALLFLGLFAYVELCVAQEPIIPLQFLAQRTVLFSSLANWFYSMSVFTYLFYVPIFYSSVLSLTPTQNGKRLISSFVGMSAGSIVAGLYMRKTGTYYKMNALFGGVAILGLLRVCFLNSQSGELTQYLILFAPGAGYTCMLTVTLLALISSVPMEFQASTTSIQYTFRATGSTLGVATASAIFQHVLKARLVSSIPKVVSDPSMAKEIIRQALESAKYADSLPENVRHCVTQAYGSGSRGAFVFSFVTMALGYICTLLIEENSLDKR